MNFTGAFLSVLCKRLNCWPQIVEMQSVGYGTEKSKGYEYNNESKVGIFHVVPMCTSNQLARKQHNDPVQPPPEA
jgi:hypothetical protein